MQLLEVEAVNKSSALHGVLRNEGTGEPTNEVPSPNTLVDISSVLL